MQKPIYLYITPYFPSPESWRGGYCLDAVKALIRDGRYDVRVIVTGHGEDYEWDCVKVIRLRRKSAPCGLVPFLLGPINNRIFKRKLNESGIVVADVAVCHVNTLGLGHYAAYFKRLNPNAKTIMQTHCSYGFPLNNGRAGIVPVHATMQYLYYRKIVSEIDLLAFVSDMSRRTFGKMYVGCPEGAIRDIRNSLLLGKWLPPLKLQRQVVLYNGVDTSLFFPKVKAKHEGFVIGCVANFQPLKDYITLLQAVNILKHKIIGLKVRLVGSGETLVECRRYVEENSLGGIVTFENEVDHRDLPDFYRGIDLFVLPSRLEGFVCVCVESWACGTPVIFCKNISLTELISDEEKDKWVFGARDPNDLANKVLIYYDKRWHQYFTKDIEINGIWRAFLDDLS